MRRLLRWAFNGAAMVSAVLLVATCAVWARSYRVFEKFDYRVTGQSAVIDTQLSTIAGRIILEREAGYTDSPITTPVGPVGFERQQKLASEMDAGPQIDWVAGRIDSDGWRKGGFGLSRTADRTTILLDGSTSGQLITWLVMLPFWAVAGAETLLPVCWATALLRKRRKSGRCRACGYDLTGNVSGTCPECGEAVKREAAP